MKTYDPKTPSRAAYQNITINVIRNENAPIIPDDLYRVTLYDDEMKNKVVIQLNGSDADGVSVLGKSARRIFDVKYFFLFGWWGGC